MAKSALGFMQLTIICGFSLFYAWYLISFFGLFILVPPDFDFVGLHIEQILFFVGGIFSTVALIAAFNKADSVAIGHTRLLYLASFLPGLLMPVAILVYSLGIDLPFPVFCLACLLTGAAAAIGFMLWEDLLTHGYLKRGVLTHGIMFCAGGVAFLAVTLFLSPIETCIVSILLLCASMALLSFIAPRCDTLEDKPATPAREYFRKSWHMEIVISVINAVFGYAFIFLYYTDANLLVGAMAVAIFADLGFAITFGRGKWFQFAGAIRICGAFVSVALLLMVCGGDVVRNVAACSIVLFWFIFRTMDGGSLTNLANRNDFSALYCATRGKMPANLGFTIGLTVGVASVALDPPSMALPYAPLALVGLFIVAVLFFLPFDNASSAVGYKTLSLVDMQESPNDNLKRQCELIKVEYKLSPRESDVLEYLVKGRNAKHISEKLYISESTAKTHISNIYRKVGIHSQQELLDMLEAA